MDSSTYDSLVTLVQRGFVDGQGNWGKYGLDDSRAAAYRYTECKANDSLNNIFSDYLKFVPWEPLELENEPLYIPFPVPLGLIGSGVTTGIGFNTTKIPRYNYFDLLNRLISLLENTTPKTIIPQITDCTITEDIPGEFEKILTVGNGRLKIVPKTSIKSTSISILGRNPLIGFTSLKKLNEKHIEANGVPLFDAIDIWNFNSTSSIDIQISLSTKSKLLNQKFISLILNSISTTTNFRVNVIENDKVVRKSIDQLLLEGYEKWKDVNLKYYTNQLQFNLEKLEELKVIQVIREIVKNNPTVSTVDAIIALNTSSFNDGQLRAVCSKHNIKTLIEAHIDINSVNTKINALNKTIANIDTVILDELKYKYLKS